MNAQALSSMTLGQLTAVYNQYADKPIKKFSCSKDAAISKILPLVPAEKPKAERKASSGERRVAKISHRGIGGTVCSLLMAGWSKEMVADRIHNDYPDKVPGRSMEAARHYVQWYIALITRAQKA